MASVFFKQDLAKSYARRYPAGLSLDETHIMRLLIAEMYINRRCVKRSVILDDRFVSVLNAHYYKAVLRNRWDIVGLFFGYHYCQFLVGIKAVCLSGNADMARFLLSHNPLHKTLVGEIEPDMFHACMRGHIGVIRELNMYMYYRKSQWNAEHISYEWIRQLFHAKQFDCLSSWLRYIDCIFGYAKEARIRGDTALYDWLRSCEM